MPADTLPRRRYPCSSCPWRRDTAGRMAYPNLAEYAASTCGQPGAEAPLGADLFGCHKSTAGELCAGWLAAAGYFHLTVRFAIATGHLEVSALEPGEGWPDLYGSYAEMAAANGANDA